MRIWQYLATKELSKYGMSVLDIADATGLTTVAVSQIQEGAKLPDTILLQYNTDTMRCPDCGNTVLSPCFLCYRDQVGNDHKIEIVLRPESHKHFMLNVHLCKDVEKE